MIAYTKDLIALLYPKTCAACQRRLQQNEDVICLFCEFDLPFSNYHQEADNILAKQFWGRVKLEEAIAFYIFVKGGRIQHLIHQLKYRGRQEIGSRLGSLYGEILQKEATQLIEDWDIIMPIPLHPAKKQRRGYNQCTTFVDSLAQQLAISAAHEILKRNIDTGTQTRLGRYQRWENVETIFYLDEKQKKELEGKHILLVDDVITTGATLEAAATIILDLPNTKVSIAGIASAITL